MVSISQPNSQPARRQSGVLDEVEVLSMATSDDMRTQIEAYFQQMVRYHAALSPSSSSETPDLCFDLT